MRDEIEELSKYGDCAYTVKQRVEYLLEDLFKERDRLREALEKEIDSLRECVKELTVKYEDGEICPACATEWEKGTMQTCGGSIIREVVALRAENARLKNLVDKSQKVVEALRFYAKGDGKRIVESAGKKHWIAEFGCGCCSKSYDIDDDGEMGVMNCELDDVSGWTAREALAEFDAGVGALRNECACGHAKSDHIYEEGACRPGFVCGSKCERYTAAIPAKDSEWLI